MISCGFPPLDQIAVDACDPSRYEHTFVEELEVATRDFTATSPQSERLYGRVSAQLYQHLIERANFNLTIAEVISQVALGQVDRGLFAVANVIQHFYGTYIGNFFDLTQFIEHQAREVVVLQSATLISGQVMAYLDHLDQHPNSITPLRPGYPTLCNRQIQLLEQMDWLHPLLQNHVTSFLLPTLKTLKSYVLCELDSRVDCFVKETAVVVLASILTPPNTIASITLIRTSTFQTEALTQLNTHFKGTDDEEVIRRHYSSISLRGIFINLISESLDEVSEEPSDSQLEL